MYLVPGQGYIYIYKKKWLFCYAHHLFNKIQLNLVQWKRFSHFHFKAKKVFLCWWNLEKEKSLSEEDYKQKTEKSKKSAGLQHNIKRCGSAVNELTIKPQDEKESQLFLNYRAMTA